MLKKREHIVAQESQVTIISECKGIYGICKQCKNKALAHEHQEEEILYDIEKNEEWEERIAVHIKSIKPFDLLLCCMTTRIIY